MKKIILAAVALTFGASTYAQMVTTKSTSGTRFGIRAGLSLPKYQYVNDNANTSTDTKTTTNFHVTGYADVPFSNYFSIQPGISLEGKGAKYYDNGTDQVEDNVLAIEIPVNVLANLPAGQGHFYLGGGPYAGFNIAGQRKTTIGNTETKNDLNFGDSNGDDLKTVDFGVNFLAGYQLNSGFNLGAGYGLGFTNLVPTSTSNTNREQNNRVWRFSVGYAF